MVARIAIRDERQQGSQACTIQDLHLAKCIILGAPAASTFRQGLNFNPYDHRLDVDRRGSGRYQGDKEEVRKRNGGGTREVSVEGYPPQLKPSFHLGRVARSHRPLMLTSGSRVGLADGTTCPAARSALSLASSFTLARRYTSESSSRILHGVLSQVRCSRGIVKTPTSRIFRLQRTRTARI